MACFFTQFFACENTFHSESVSTMSIDYCFLSVFSCHISIGCDSRQRSKRACEEDVSSGELQMLFWNNFSSPAYPLRGIHPAHPIQMCDVIHPSEVMEQVYYMQPSNKRHFPAVLVHRNAFVRKVYIWKWTSSAYRGFTFKFVTLLSMSTTPHWCWDGIFGYHANHWEA